MCPWLRFSNFSFPPDSRPVKKLCYLRIVKKPVASLSLVVGGPDFAVPGVHSPEVDCAACAEYLQCLVSDFQWFCESEVLTK